MGKSSSSSKTPFHHTPFYNPSTATFDYGTVVRSSADGVTTPLRRRENDPFVCSSTRYEDPVREQEYRLTQQQQQRKHHYEEDRERQQQQQQQPKPKPHRRRGSNHNNCNNASSTSHLLSNHNHNHSCGYSDWTAPAQTPHSHRHRFRGNFGGNGPNDRWVHYVMRAVLLSPVIVLAVWSAAALAFTHHRGTNSNDQGLQSARVPARPKRGSTTMTGTTRKDSRHGRHRLVSTEAANEGLLEIVEVVETALGSKQGHSVLASSPRAGRGVPWESAAADSMGGGGGDDRSNRLLPVYVPLGNARTGTTSGGTSAAVVATGNLIIPPLPIQQQQVRAGVTAATADQSLASPQERQLAHTDATPVSPVHDASRGGAPVLVQPPVGVGKDLAVASMYMQPDPAMGVRLQQAQVGAANLLQPPKGPRATSGTLMAVAQPQQQQEQPYSSAPNQLQPHLRGFATTKQYNPVPAYIPQGSGTALYYYDSRMAGPTATGQWILPDVVWDSTGRPVSLRMALGSAREVYLQQQQQSAGIPVLGMIHQNASTLNATKINVTHSHPNTIDTPVRDRRMGSPRRTMGLSGIKEKAAVLSSSLGSISSSSATDQSIIVATVGVMALLVGALSARRLRSRSWMSACIENESLHDDAAYDTAYTTVADVAGGRGSNYRTFQHHRASAAAAVGWKGDLEKFDV